MAHQLDFKNKKYEQWVKAGLGVEYLGEGLYPFCDEVVTRQHNDILDTIKQTKNLSTVTCGQCNLNKLKPDHVQTGNKQCPLSQANCNCLHPSGKQPCPNDVCGAIYDHIVTNYGSTPPAPYWRNTEAKWWCTDPWSVAKCFINSPVHYDIIDCTGFLRLIINNQGFHNHIQCTINGTDVFSKVLQYSNEIFHSSSMELEENTANTYIDAMIAILQDDKELKTREYAQNAVQKLLELKKDDFIIPTKDELHMANASMASISGTTEEFESKLQEMKELKTEQPRQRDLGSVRRTVVVSPDDMMLPTVVIHPNSPCSQGSVRRLVVVPPDDMMLPTVVIHRPNSPCSQDTDARPFALSDTDDETPEELFVKDFFKEINRSDVPQTINREDIQAQVKQFKHSKQSRSSHALRKMIKGIVKDTSAKRSKESVGISETQTPSFGQEQNQRETPWNENQQIQKEIKSSPNCRAVGDDDEEFACQGGKGAVAVTPLNENEQVKEEIISSSKYQAAEDDDEEFDYQEGMRAPTPLNENLQIEKETKSSPKYQAVGDDDEEFENHGGVFAVTSLNENEKIKEDIISSSRYQAVEDDNEEFGYIGGMIAPTPLNENLQIKKETKSLPKYQADGDDDEEFANQGGVFAVTPLNENERTKEEIISSKYQAVEDDDGDEFDCQGGDEEWMSFLCSGNKKIAKRLVKLRHFPTQRILDEICLLFGRKSNVTLFICNAICAHIKTKDEHIIDVWAAYTLKRTNSITFVVSLQEEEKTGKKEKAESIPLHKMINYSFIKRRVGEYSYEGTEIINHNAPDEYIDADAYCKLQDCVAKYSVELMKEHRYLSLVSVCSKRSTGYGSTSWELKLGNCIVLYVHTKHYIPINEEPFKPHYDGIPVDVREGAFIPFGRTAVEFLEHVQMGCQICGDNNAKGTLGCFIDHPQYGVCGLTCAHVLLSPWELDWVKTVKSGTSIWPLHSFSKKVYQPTKQDSSIGHAVQLIHKEGSGNNSGMDLALFKLTSRHPKSPDFPNASGVMPAGKINYEHWQICSMDRLNLRTERVVKFGAKTEFRNGVIEFDRLSVKHLNCSLQNEYTTITLHKQIEVRPQILSVAFAEPGDSGALVFLGGENDSEHTCIGIIEGGTTNGTVVVTPIVAILDELKVSSLKSFEAENTISEIHGRIENVGNEVQTVRSEVQNVSTKINTMGSSISGMQEGQQAISSDIQHLKQMVIAISTSPNTQQSTDSPNI